MCGFIRRVTDCEPVKDMLREIGLGHLVLPAGDYRPAQSIQGVIINDGQAERSVGGIWWYTLMQAGGQWKANTRAKTLNARNLELKTWREPLVRRRAIVIADAIGESRKKAGTKTVKRFFLMRGAKPLILGALYKRYGDPADPIHGVSIITGKPRADWQPIHDDSMPVCLPPDPMFIERWLDPNHVGDDEIDDVLARPRLYQEIRATEVKSYSSETPVSDDATTFLPAD